MSKTPTMSNLVSYFKHMHKPEYNEYLKKKEANWSSLSAANASSSGGSCAPSMCCAVYEHCVSCCLSSDKVTCPLLHYTVSQHS